MENTMKSATIKNFLGASAIFAFVLLALNTIPSSYAADAAADVQARQDMMEINGKAMKTLGGMMGGKIDFDANQLSEAATVLATNSGEAFTKYFTKDSIVGDSEASPAIWNEMDKFSALSNDLSFYAAILARSAANPRVDGAAEIAMLSAEDLKNADKLAAMGPDVAFGLAAATCGTCHKAYREKK